MRYMMLHNKCNLRLSKVLIVIVMVIVLMIDSDGD